MKLVDLVKQAEGRTIRGEKGRREPLRLLPPVSEEQVRKLEQALPGPLPAEIRELFTLTRGFENGPYEVDFSGYGRAAFGERTPFGVVSECFQILPYKLSIATDGCGNDWMIDLTKGASVWGPVFFACHDPPVFVFTAGDLREFIEEWLELAQEKECKLGRAFDQAVMRVWTENPDRISHVSAIRSDDPEIRAFAERVGDGFQFCDLRRAASGAGFSRGHVDDPDTDMLRDGGNLLFAILQALTEKAILTKAFWG
ncbi:MAG: SMI1/KNR4 family protein [Verrucomicrobiota bacterium]